MEEPSLTARFGAAILKRERLYWAVLLLAGSFCALILAPSVEAASGGAGIVNAVARLAFRGLCHQLPERSLWLGGACLPVCARCTGIYFGFFVGWALWRLAPRERRDRPASGLFLALTLGPLALDGSLNAIGLVNSPAALRLATGLLCGAAGARALWPALLEAAAALAGGRSFETKPESLREG